MDMFSTDGLGALGWKVGAILGAFAILFVVRALGGGKPDPLGPARRRRDRRSRGR
jgi:hypothetical protein